MDDGAKAAKAATKLVDLRRDQCRWPINVSNLRSGVPYLFCGEPKEPGKPYCAAHAFVSRHGSKP